MAERFPDFEIQEIQELKENLENQNAKKSTLTWPMSGPAGPKTRTLPKTNLLPATKRNNSTKINRWRYITEFLRL